MDEIFFQAEAHQALQEPMVAECARSAPVACHVRPRLHRPAARVSVFEAVRAIARRWFLPLRTAPPAWA
jgi:hypothetical protein